MIRIVFVALGALAFAACEADSPTPDAAPDSAVTMPPEPALDTVASLDSAGGRMAPLTADGWGVLRIGMRRDEVVAAAGVDANPNAAGGVDPEQCEQFRPLRAPEGLLVMIVGGRLGRISISRDAPVRTDRGFGVGDSASAIRAAYGSDATITPHEYQDAPAAYITWWSANPPSSEMDPAPDARGIVYEIGQDGVVSHVHAGGPAIRYVEGCA